MKHSTYRRQWIEYCRDVGLCEYKDFSYKNREHTRRAVPTVTAHQLRHKYATILHEAHIDEKDAQELLGHSSIVVTKDIYTHISQKQKEETRQKLNQFAEKEFGEK